MKIMFASDIHGSAFYCRKTLECFDKEKADRLFILGDILYHGPRNNLSMEYAPKEVLAMLNERKNEISAVRGNCDGEVDQMVLDFPIMADYALLEVNGLRIYATHGHIYNEKNMLPMMPGDILIHGHTHIYMAKKAGENYILNPGSTSLPKGGNPPTYAILDGKTFQIKELDGSVVKEITFGNYSDPCKDS